MIVNGFNKAVSLSEFLDSADYFLSNGCSLFGWENKGIEHLAVAEASALLRTQHAELEALRKEVERLRKDAERLDWLEMHPEQRLDFYKGHWALSSPTSESECTMRPRLREAIDDTRGRRDDPQKQHHTKPVII